MGCYEAGPPNNIQSQTVPRLDFMEWYQGDKTGVLYILIRVISNNGLWLP